MGSRALRRVAQVALPIAASFIPGIGPAVGAALGGAAAGAIGGGGVRGALLGAATGYAGNAIGSSLSGSFTSGLSRLGASNSVTNGLANTTIGRLASNVVGPATGSSALGGALGRVAGNSIADNLASSFTDPAVEQSAPKVQEPAGFNPTQESQLQLPNSLSGFSSLDPNQQSSNIATQGVYGSGNGPQEEDYFTNLINRRLVDESGNVDQDLSEINPIENSYLSQLGISGDNPSSILEALYGRRNQRQSAYT